MKKITVFLALVAISALVPLAASAELWKQPHVTGTAISAESAHKMSKNTLASAIVFSETSVKKPLGSILINATYNEWCESNCGKLTQVDKSLFATEATEKAKLLRTSQFLNDTYPKHNGYWCEAQKSIHSYGSFHC